MENDTYIIASKRHARDRIPSNWVEQLGDIIGVEVVGAGAFRAQIHATPQAIEKLSSLFGSDFNIEPVIQHQQLSGDER